MSSQADGDLGRNAVMCYFPTLPYCVSYQIGFDIIINPPGALADPLEAGEPHHVIYVELFFPDGFMRNPATFAGMAHPLSFESDAPHFYPAQPHFCPPMFPDLPHATPHNDHHLSMGFEELLMCQELAHVANGQLEDFMEIDHMPYNIIRQCNVCREIDSVQEGMHNQSPRSVPKPSLEEPGHSHQRPSASGTTGKSGKSQASPRKVSKRVATDNSQRGTSHTSQRTASGRDATDRKNNVQNEGPTISIKTTHGNLKMVIIEGINGLPGEDCSITFYGSEPTDELIAHAVGILEIFGENNDENMPKVEKKTNEDPNVDNDK